MHRHLKIPGMYAGGSKRMNVMSAHPTPGSGAPYPGIRFSMCSTVVEPVRLLVTTKSAGTHSEPASVRGLS